jgi:hypothetical protein
MTAIKFTTFKYNDVKSSTYGVHKRWNVDVYFDINFFSIKNFPSFLYALYRRFDLNIIYESCVLRSFWYLTGQVPLRNGRDLTKFRNMGLTPYFDDLTTSICFFGIFCSNPYYRSKLPPIFFQPGARKLKCLWASPIFRQFGIPRHFNLDWKKPIDKIVSYINLFRQKSDPDLRHWLSERI